MDADSDSDSDNSLKKSSSKNAKKSKKKKATFAESDSDSDVENKDKDLNKSQILLNNKNLYDSEGSSDEGIDKVAHSKGSSRSNSDSEVRLEIRKRLRYVSTLQLGYPKYLCKSKLATLSFCQMR